MARVPRYAPSVSKAVEVVLWITTEAPELDIYHVVKAAFFADKKHVSEFGRPIIGDDYDAAAFGPLPKVVYGLLINSPIEMLAWGGNGKLPFSVDGAYRVTADREADGKRLSESDVECLAFGVAHVRDKTFDELYRETHDDPAYVRANGSLMDYREFIPDSDPHKPKKAAFLSDVDRHVEF